VRVGYNFPRNLTFPPTSGGISSGDVAVAARYSSAYKAGSTRSGDQAVAAGYSSAQKPGSTGSQDVAVAAGYTKKQYTSGRPVQEM
jgi:hypothetical protein